MNIFEQASIGKFRFNSERGALSVEQLWDMPLTSKHGFDLDTLARETNKQIKTMTEEGFVTMPNTAALDVLETKLEILKHIIATKMAATAALKDRAIKRAEREKLIDILAAKQDEALKALSQEEIAKRVAELDTKLDM